MEDGHGSRGHEEGNKGYGSSVDGKVKGNDKIDHESWGHEEGTKGHRIVGGRGRERTGA